MPILEFKDFYKGGIADSDYSGNLATPAKLVGFDLHGEPGILKSQPTLLKNSGSTVTERITCGVGHPDGNTYFGGSSGSIYKRTAAGVWSNEGTVAPAAGSAGITDMKAFNMAGTTYLVYSMQSRLGRWNPAGAFGTRTDNYQVFGVTNLTEHPIFELKGFLYIGDGYQIAALSNGGSFTANALVLPLKYVVSSLINYGPDLLIGTYVDRTDELDASVFRWNTVATQATNQSTVPEEGGVYTFFRVYNEVWVQCGNRMAFYKYLGDSMTLTRRIRGDYTKTNMQGYVRNNGTASWRGIPVFGLSQGVNGNNPVEFGVYSIGCRDTSKYQIVTDLSFPATVGTSDVLITAIVADLNTLMVAWETTSGTPTYGVDILQSTASTKYNGSYFETGVITVNRRVGKNIKVMVPYRSLPASTDIIIKYKKQGDSSYTTMTSLDDTIHFYKYSQEDISRACSFQVRIETTASAATAPEIESLILEY